MSRTARLYSSTGIYHVMVRGNERKPLFLDDMDHRKFLNTMRLVRDETPYTLYAFCLMKNHVHLLLHDEQNQLPQIMKSINTAYALYFNMKYDRVGHVFQGRYKSEVVEDEPYLLAAVRYIHNNPVKANLVSQPVAYQWSSYDTYIRENAPFADLTDCQTVLGLFAHEVQSARKAFIDFSQHESVETFIEPWKEETANIVHGEEMHFIENYLRLNKIELYDLKNKQHKNTRNALIRTLKDNSALSIREIGELLNIDRNIIQRQK